MPAYNQMKYIADAVDSVKRQTYTNWELLIIDDGSPDNIMQLALKFEKSDSRIHAFHTPNRGLAGARNFGIRQARGEYILPLDADDTLEPEYIAACIKAFLKNPLIKVAYTQWRFFGTTNRTTKIHYQGYPNLLARNSIFATAMYRRKDALEIGGYDENIRISFEDWEFWIRLLDEKSIVYQDRRALFNYRKKEMSMSVAGSTEGNLSKMHLYIITKHIKTYNHYFGMPLDAMRCKLKYDRVFYRRFWHWITGKK